MLDYRENDKKEAEKMNYFDSDTFCERAIQLFGETGQKKLSEKLGISQAVISSIKTKSAKSPSADTIFLIAKEFGVSADWLLGLSDVRSTDKATKELCDTLGLSEKSINILTDATDIYAKNAINWLIKQHAESIEKQYKNMLEITQDSPELIQAIKDRAQWEPQILSESIIYCLSSLIDLLEKPMSDMQFTLLESGTLSVALFDAVECTNEIFIENANQTISTKHDTTSFPKVLKEQIPSALAPLLEYSFSYKRVLVNSFRQKIADMIAAITNEKIEHFEHENYGKLSVKAITEYCGRGDGTNGND